MQRREEDFPLWSSQWFLTSLQHKGVSPGDGNEQGGKNFSYPPEREGKWVMSLYLGHKAALLQLDNKKPLKAELFLSKVHVSWCILSFCFFPFAFWDQQQLTTLLRSNVTERNLQLMECLHLWCFAWKTVNMFLCLTFSSKRGTSLFWLRHGSLSLISHSHFTGQAPVKKH